MLIKQLLIHKAVIYCLPLLPKHGLIKQTENPCRDLLFRAVASWLCWSMWCWGCCGDPAPSVAACPSGASTPAWMQSSSCFLSVTALLALTGSIPQWAQGCIPCLQGSPHSTDHPGWEPCARPGHSCHQDPPGSCTGSLGFVLDEKEPFRSGSVSPVLLVQSCQPWQGCVIAPGRWAAFAVSSACSDELWLLELFTALIDKYYRQRAIFH